jgi:hypothetical protein
VGSSLLNVLAKARDQLETSVGSPVASAPPEGDLAAVANDLADRVEAVPARQWREHPDAERAVQDTAEHVGDLLRALERQGDPN